MPNKLTRYAKHLLLGLAVGLAVMLTVFAFRAIFA